MFAATYCDAFNSKSRVEILLRGSVEVEDCVLS